MILELILFLAILGIFILVLRKLPEALRDGGESSVNGSVPQRTRESWFTGIRAAATTRATSLWQQVSARRPKAEQPPQKLTTAHPAPSPSSRPQETLLSEEALMHEGDVYFVQGKLKEAERAFLRAVAKNPRQPKLYNRLGAIYLKQRNYADALEAFQAARDLDASRASRHYNVALAAWHLGKRPKAKEAINEALRLDGESIKYRDLKRQIDDGK
ncbi:MAG: tetratricopeptide repeat protein [Patescibacteria group bacterium]|jgi:tetratricopeptide (TPR) repeat protein